MDLELRLRGLWKGLRHQALKMNKEWKSDKKWKIQFQNAQRWVNLVAWFVAAAGLLDILEGLSPREPSVIGWMEQFLPMDVSESSRLGMYLTGLSLLAIARGIWRRKRAAWWLAVILLFLTTLLQFARGPDFHHIVLEKYQPDWQGRYLGFRPSVNLVLAAVALVRVHLPQGLLRILWS